MASKSAPPVALLSPSYLNSSFKPSPVLEHIYQDLCRMEGFSNEIEMEEAKKLR